MNKIYNNLNIENLIKTDWFKQFSISQKQVIKQGLEDNLDIFVYAKKEFNWKQMDEIRLGLKNNVDVSIYAKPEFDYLQMKEIRLGLEKNKFKAFVYAKSIYFFNKINLKLF